MSGKKRLIQAAQALFFLLCFAAVALWLRRFMIYRLDSDMASELILARMLREEGGLLSRNWYYSTELRVLYTQWVTVPLLRLFSSWYSVRVLAALLLSAVLVLSYAWLCRQGGLRGFFFLFAAWLVLPTSHLYYDLVLSAGAYSPFLILSFLLAGMALSAARSESRRRRRIIAAALCLLSFFSSLNGPRQLVMFHAPLCMAALWLLLPRRRELSKGLRTFLSGWESRFFLLSAGSGVSAAAGYLVNALLLSRFYTFQSHGLHPAAPSGEKLSQLWQGVLACFGYISGRPQTWLNVLAASLALLSLALALYACCRPSFPARFFGALYLSAVLVFFLLYLFTDTDYSARYFLPAAVLALPMFHSVLTEENAAPRQRGVGAAALVLLLAVGAGGYIAVKDTLRPDIDTRPALEGQAVADLLVESGYQNGYATFWNGNVLTELSDGALEMWVLSPDGSGLYPWLQDIRHKQQAPAGPVFLILGPGEDAIFSPDDPTALEEFLIYSSPRYRIYGFESNAALQRILSSYRSRYEREAPFLLGGEYRDGKVILPPGSTLYGPYIFLAAGAYDVSIRGEGLAQAAFDCVYNAGQTAIPAENIHVEDREISFRLTLENFTEQVELRLFNRNASSVIFVEEITVLPRS